MKERNLAMIWSQTALMLVELEGMKAENLNRQHRDESMAYTEDDFIKLKKKYEFYLRDDNVWNLDWS